MSYKDHIHRHVQTNTRAVSDSPFYALYQDHSVHMPIRYDGDEIISEVDADYVMWEVHGRTDFRYTSTASQV